MDVWINGLMEGWAGNYRSKFMRYCVIFLVR